MIHNRPTATQTGPTTMSPMRSPSTPRSPLEQMSTVSVHMFLMRFIFSNAQQPTRQGSRPSSFILWARCLSPSEERHIDFPLRFGFQIHTHATLQLPT